MTTESMREKFEAWLNSCNCDPLYWNTSDAMFAAWQAATLAERERWLRRRMRFAMDVDQWSCCEAVRRCHHER